MFEVGFTEILLIMGLALLVLGPEKLPGLAAKLGQWTGRARAMARQLRTQLEQEVTVDGFDKPAARPPADPTPTPPPAAASTGEPVQTGDSTDAHTNTATAETQTAGEERGGAQTDSSQHAPGGHATAGENAAQTPEPVRPVTEKLAAQTMVSGMEPEPPPATTANTAPAAASHSDAALDVHNMVSGMEPAPTPEPAAKPEA